MMWSRIRYRVVLRRWIVIDVFGGGLSGSGTTGVGGSEGTVVVIVCSGAGATIVGSLAGTVVVVVISAGVTVVVVVVGTGVGSTGVE